MRSVLVVAGVGRNGLFVPAGSCGGSGWLARCGVDILNISRSVRNYGVVCASIGILECLVLRIDILIVVRTIEAGTQCNSDTVLIPMRNQALVNQTRLEVEG